MIAKFRKLLGRGKTGGLNLLRFWLNALTNFGASLLVVRYLESPELWGAFVHYFIIVGLFAMVLNWGNREYLLREISFQPAQLKKLWTSNILSRLVLIIFPILYFLIFPVSKEFLPFVGLWLFSFFLLQSTDVLQHYYKRYFPSLFGEIANGIIVIGGIFFFKNELTVLILCQLFAIGTLFNALITFVPFASNLSSVFQWDQKHLSHSFVFFLMGASGMLVSRIDLYAVDYFLDDHSLGLYQVMMAFFIQLQSLGSLVIQPFVKNIYRLKPQSILRFSWSNLSWGWLMIVGGIGAVAFILTQLYQYPLDWTYFLLGGLLVLPIYVYSPLIYWLYKKNELWVLVINLLSFGINLLLNIWWIPIWGLKGALLSSMLIQWFLLGVYSFLMYRETRFKN